MSIRVCLYCGKEFEGEGKQKYCSRQCMQKHWYEKNYKPVEPRTNACLFCGNEFTSKTNRAKFCGVSCNEKYRRRLIKRYCAQCNKELEVGGDKFCSIECNSQYYIDNPKYTRECAYCGEEFKTNEKSVRLCSKECQNKYQAENTLKKRERIFKRKFEKKYLDFEYLEGYRNWRSYIKCKCKICGHIQTRSAQCIKPEKGDILTCNNCIGLRTERKKLINLLIKYHNDIVKEQNKIIKEKELVEQRIEKEKALENYICAECGATFKAINISQRYCSIECSNKRNNRIKEINKRKRLRENGKVNWDISLSKLIKRDKNICHICGEKCNKKDYIIDEYNNFIVGKSYPSIDHVIPVSKGGTHTWDNVKLAHHYCNTIKSDNEVYEDRKGQLKMSI